jgi:hypothetical protein
LFFFFLVFLIAITFHIRMFVNEIGHARTGICKERCGTAVMDEASVIGDITFR